MWAAAGIRPRGGYGLISGEDLAKAHTIAMSTHNNAPARAKRMADAGFLPAPHLPGGSTALTSWAAS